MVTICLSAFESYTKVIKKVMPCKKNSIKIVLGSFWGMIIFLGLSVEEVLV
ncbi:hypothetical protein J2X17_002135 [Flavobacterium aquidurense]|nr:hypothetical protein [Flavobacterium aquidurense]